MKTAREHAHAEIDAIFDDAGDVEVHTTIAIGMDHLPDDTFRRNGHATLVFRYVPPQR